MVREWQREPKIVGHRIVAKDLVWGGYNKVYTAGSSKGGTCAIYYGLQLNVTEVFSSACQYHVGNYLNKEHHRKILEGMMGKNYCKEDVERLNNELPTMIKNNAHSTTFVHLYYSEGDHTYQDHIIDLIKDLQSADIHISRTVDDYVNHDDNGLFFQKYLKERFIQ